MSHCESTCGAKEHQLTFTGSKVCVPSGSQLRRRGGLRGRGRARTLRREAQRQCRARRRVKRTARTPHPRSNPSANMSGQIDRILANCHALCDLLVSGGLYRSFTLENHSALVTLLDLLQGGHVGRVPRPSTRTTTPKAPDRLGIRTVGIPTRNATRVALVVAAQSENSRLMEARRDVNRL